MVENKTQDDLKTVLKNNQKLADALNGKKDIKKKKISELFEGVKKEVKKKKKKKVKKDSSY